MRESATRSWTRRSILAAAGLAVAHRAIAQDSPKPGPRKPSKPDESDAFFDKGVIPQLTLEIDESGIESLRANARTYVPATIRENGSTTFAGVGIKLKGAAGSFREIDDRPAFTVDIDRFGDSPRFRGLKKFHLNNSVQDEAFACEWIGSESFRAAGIPAPRVTHARVVLNGRDLGLYVLKEAFDRTFLARYFADSNGNLYDGGFCQEIDAELEKDSGTGPDDRSDLAALAAACRESDPTTRWQRIDQLLDVDVFLRFIALELCLGHWDGYSQNANNYRLYFDPTTGKAYFLPHGMDQLFQSPDAAVLDYPNTLVADAVMRNPEWRARYRRTLSETVADLKLKDKLPAKLKALQKRLTSALTAIDANVARDHEQRMRELNERIAERERFLREEVRRPEPKSLTFDARGRARPTGFAQHVDEGDAALEQSTLKGKRVFEIRCGNEPCVASWRKKVTLPKGRFAFECEASGEGIAPRADEPEGGAGVRLSGTGAATPLVGTATWRTLRHEFEVVEETRQVELIAELRAARGVVRFELASFRILALR
jgi:spore coat protein H